MAKTTLSKTLGVNVNAPSFLGAWKNDIKGKNLVAIGLAVVAGVALYNMFAPKGFPRITAPTGMQWTLP